jgi:hypothetical protein
VSLFADRVRKAMREQRVTIRQLARAMGVTMKRVRVVRTLGTPPPWGNASEHSWMRDWFDGIRKAALINSTTAKEKS